MDLIICTDMDDFNTKEAKIHDYLKGQFGDRYRAECWAKPMVHPIDGRIGLACSSEDEIGQQALFAFNIIDRTMLTIVTWDESWNHSE